MRQPICPRFRFGLRLLAVSLLAAANVRCATAADTATPATPSAETASAATASAGEAAATLGGGGLSLLDWTLIAIYAVATIALGWYFGRRQKSTKEYFVGSGNMHPLLVGVSLFATLLSTITYLSLPGEILGKGPVYLAVLAALPLTYVVVAYGLLPVYMKHNVTSAYELLEKRLGISVRLLGATMFLVMRLVWMSLLIYLAAKAMSVMLYGDTHHVTMIIWITGAVSVFYASIGGLRAVVITDFFQTMLLFGGALLVVAIISLDFGGFGWFPTQWQDHWDSQPLYSFDPKIRVTVLGSVLSVLTWYVCTAGGDQVSVQRFMATRDVKTARRALAVQLTVTMIVQLTLGIVGLALLGYYAAHPSDIPTGMTLKSGADHLFPQFIAHELPMGISGLVVAAMFAAAMSSIDSGVNSITAVVTTDFLGRFGFRPRSEARQVLAARLLALCIGIIIVFSSSYMQYIEGNITTVTSKTVNLLTPPLFALFVFAIFIPFARPLGVWIGTLGGVAVALTLAFSGAIAMFLFDHYQIDPAVWGTEIVTTIDPLTQAEVRSVPDPVSFQWIGPATLVVNLSLGIAVSWLLPRRGAADA
ncbi:MAG: sodium/solute symporter [Planctomycetales bacterium]|nr:sodium/solute symporter [Planctomycetales bacterium]